MRLGAYRTRSPTFTTFTRLVAGFCAWPGTRTGLADGPQVCFELGTSNTKIARSCVRAKKRS
jgi:hypothetical protein